MQSMIYDFMQFYTSLHQHFCPAGRISAWLSTHFSEVFKIFLSTNLHDMSFVYYHGAAVKAINRLLSGNYLGSDTWFFLLCCCRYSVVGWFWDHSSHRRMRGCRDICSNIASFDAWTLTPEFKACDTRGWCSAWWNQQDSIARSIAMLLSLVFHCA